jgi:hypothetical protein
MQAEASMATALSAARLRLRMGWLCGVVLFLEGYDIASVGYAIPLLADAWKFTLRRSLRC